MDNNDPLREMGTRARSSESAQSINTISSQSRQSLTNFSKSETNLGANPSLEGGTVADIATRMGSESDIFDFASSPLRCTSSMRTSPSSRGCCCRPICRYPVCWHNAAPSSAGYICCTQSTLPEGASSKSTSLRFRESGLKEGKRPKKRVRE